MLGYINYSFDFPVTEIEVADISCISVKVGEHELVAVFFAAGCGY